jgi:hypothetical protein
VVSETGWTYNDSTSKKIVPANGVQAAAEKEAGDRGRRRVRQDLPLDCIYTRIFPDCMAVCIALFKSLGAYTNGV